MKTYVKEILTQAHKERYMRIFISVLFVAAGIEVYLDVQHWKNREEKCGKSIP